MKWQTSNENGFTLIEVLISTMIFAVLVTAISSVLYSALHLRDDAQTNSELQERLSLTNTIMKRDFINLVAPQEGLAQDLLCESAGRGSNNIDHLECYTASGIINQNQPFGEIQGIQYLLTDQYQSHEKEGFELVRFIYRNLLSNTEEQPTHIRLLDEVQSLDFQFYDGESWFDSWDSSEQDPPMPKAIQTRITFVSNSETEERLRPLEFVVPIHVIAPTEDEEQEEQTTSDDTQEEDNQSGGSEQIPGEQNNRPDNNPPRNNFPTNNRPNAGGRI